MFATLLPRLQSWALTALAVVAVLVGAYAYGGYRARKSQELKDENERLRKDLAVERGNVAARDIAVESMNARRDAEVEISHMAPGEAQRQLREEWARD